MPAIFAFISNLNRITQKIKGSTISYIIVKGDFFFGDGGI